MNINTTDLLPICARHRDGWCELLNQRKPQYSDELLTKCGCVIVFPWAIKRHKATCEECNNTKQPKGQK